MNFAIAVVFGAGHSNGFFVDVTAIWIVGACYKFAKTTALANQFATTIGAGDVQNLGYIFFVFSNHAEQHGDFGGFGVHIADFLA